MKNNVIRTCASEQKTVALSTKLSKA